MSSIWLDTKNLHSMCAKGGNNQKHDTYDVNVSVCRKEAANGMTKHSALRSHLFTPSSRSLILVAARHTDYLYLLQHMANFPLLFFSNLVALCYLESSRPRHATKRKADITLISS